MEECIEIQMPILKKIIQEKRNVLYNQISSREIENPMNILFKFILEVKNKLDDVDDIFKLENEIREVCDKVGVNIRNISIQPLNNKLNTKTKWNDMFDGNLEIGSLVNVMRKDNNLV